jgi:PAS domain S-box-containing protein
MIKKTGTNAKIRAKAEELLADKIKDQDIPEAVNELIHELQVHKIELEIQNEELKRYQSRLQTSQNRYYEMYNFAPIGYFTLDENELIKDVNIEGANLLEIDKNKLINSAFIRFIASKSRKRFFEYIKNFRLNKEYKKCELELLKDEKPFTVIMEINSRPNDEGGLESLLITVIDINQRKKAEQEIESSLKEKETLLKEIHHRVKNNLQIISSLLDLQEVYVVDNPTAVNLLKESQNRVLSMAMIHEMIYQSEDLSHINFPDYIKSLISNLFDSYNVKAIQPIIDVEDIYLNIETSVPLGLIISEIVSNSLKYAFPENKGTISIELQPKKDKFKLTIKDNGVGIPPEIDFETESTLGLRLVKSLVGQLDGTIELDKSHGTKYTIKFQELQYKKRM